MSGEIGPGTLVECVNGDGWEFADNGEAHDIGPKSGDICRVTSVYEDDRLRLCFAPWPMYGFDAQFFRPLGPRDPDWLSRKIAEHSPEKVGA